MTSKIEKGRFYVNWRSKANNQLANSVYVIDS